MTSNIPLQKTPLSTSEQFKVLEKITLLSQDERTQNLL